MQASEFIDTAFDVFNASRERRHLYLTPDDTALDGKHIELAGERFLSFGSCSYLGLETDPRLREGVRRAVDRYGTQFSSSRSYLSAPPYRAIEERLSVLTGGHALVTPTTTLGHIATLPVIVSEKDAIVMDHQVHASVQIGATLARANGAHVELVRHGDRAKVDERVAALCRSHRHVWYAFDGVFSMFGDLPDVAHARALLERHEQLHLYVDDAHGTSIAGLHGRGVHLARMGHHPRQIVSLSLNKAFAASGGCLVYPTEAMRERVRLCGGTMVFSGPIQPPMLGAIGASAEIHLSPEIAHLQGALRERIVRFNELLLERELPLLAENEAPIFFVKTGPLRAAWALAERVRSDGIYVNITPYPGVPMKRTGVRIALTRHHSFEDLERLADSLARHYPAMLDAEGMNIDDVEGHFSGIPRVETGRARLAKRLGSVFGDGVVLGEAPLRHEPVKRDTVIAPPELELVRTSSIDELDTAEWDQLLGSRGLFSSGALRLLEQTFRGREEKESNWGFHYFVARYRGKPVLATFFTDAIWKEDMLMRAEVSARVEEQRKTDPDFLTSRILAMGSLLTEGDHLFLDRDGPWRAALAWLLEELEVVRRETRCTAILLRDLPAGDAEADRLLLDEGLVKIPVLPSYDLDVTTWRDDEDFLHGLGRQTRKAMRAEVLAPEGEFDVRVHGVGSAPPHPDLLARCDALYRGVKARKLRLNTHALPDDLLARACETPGFELLTLSVRGDQNAPGDDPIGPSAETSETAEVGAMGLGYAFGDRYVAIFCGLDYSRRSLNLYRQLLWQFIKRARARDCKWLSLGMDADFEKSRLGAHKTDHCAYLLATDFFSGAVLNKVVQDVALSHNSQPGRTGT